MRRMAAAFIWWVWAYLLLIPTTFLLNHFAGTHVPVGWELYADMSEALPPIMLVAMLCDL